MPIILDPIPGGVAEGYYAKYATMRRKVGPLNLAAFSNLDASGQVYTEDSTIVQEGMDEADRYVDERARYCGITVDSLATSPHVIATSNVHFGRISDLASAIADAEIYRARGLTGDANNEEGQMSDMDKRAKAELDQIFSTMLGEQAASVGSNGAEVIKVPCAVPVYCGYWPHWRW